MRLRIEMALRLDRGRGEHLGFSDDESNANGLQSDANSEPSIMETVVTNLRKNVTTRMRISAQETNEAVVETEIEDIENEIMRMETQASQGVNLGPSFKLVGS